MSATATGTALRYHGFDGAWELGAFVVALAAIVIGALMLADGVLEYLAVSGMPSYLNSGTLIFGNLVWWVDVATGAVLAAAGGVVALLARPSWAARAA